MEKHVCSNCKAASGMDELWPGIDGHLCQGCWEKECSKTWWEDAAPHWIEPVMEESD